MVDSPLSFTGLFVLQAVAQGHRFGFDIMEVTELPSGTIYPALRRLEAVRLVPSGATTSSPPTDVASSPPPRRVAAPSAGSFPGAAPHDQMPARRDCARGARGRPSASG